jgi:hypothetical protein
MEPLDPGDREALPLQENSIHGPPHSDSQGQNLLPHPKVRTYCLILAALGLPNSLGPSHPTLPHSLPSPPLRPLQPKIKRGFAIARYVHPRNIERVYRKPQSGPKGYRDYAGASTRRVIRDSLAVLLANESLITLPDRARGGAQGGKLRETLKSICIHLFINTLKRHIKQPTAYSLQPTAYSLQHTAYSLQHTAYTLQPSAYSLRPTAYSI